MTESSLATLFSLEGRTALVTGASSGIGRALATTLAEAGAAVVLLARRRPQLEALESELRQRGGRAAVVTCDVADRAALTRAAKEASTPFGAPDILVNAAGINPRKPADTVSPSEWDATVAINLTAPFFLAQCLAPAMCTKGWGRIVNIASLQSVRAFPDGAPYGATKAGIVQLTRALAQAWSPRGVNCNAIAPGFFPTALTAALMDDPARAAELAGRTMVGRNGVLDDLRGTLVYLASRASDYVTGQTIFVDGGFTAG